MEANNHQKKIKILTMDAFPKGYATTNRIVTYAKGLVEAGCKVEVCCIKPTENQDNAFNYEIKGKLYGASFRYYSGETVKSKNYLKRQYQNIIGVIKFFKTFMFEKEKTDCVILYATSPFLGVLIYFASKFKGCLYLKEENEFPEVHTKHQSSISNFLFEKFQYKKADGLLLMTNKLINHFKIDKQINTPILHTPMTVDFNRFDNIKKSNRFSVATNYIGYCGSLNNQKDGLKYLINSFLKIANKYPNLNLLIAGDVESKEDYPDYLSYLKMVKESNMQNRIQFLGRIDSDDIPEFLTNSHILVLARPDSNQANAGFPTKLGEYLCTAKPVIVTSVGEINHYLTDNENAFFIEPGNELSLTKKIEEVLNNYENALLIARKGKDVVLRNFNYKIQANNINHFIDKLTNN